MSRVPSKHSRDQTPDFEGLLGNLQDWELSFKDKEKKLKSQPISKEKKLSETGVNEKQSMGKAPFTNSSATKQYDYLKSYDQIGKLSSNLIPEENFIDANSEKEWGNEYFKQKKFNEAIDCYSRSIALSPTAVAYANRAMAYLKIKRFQEAENDCGEALNLDDRYIKAYSRRSTARKELGKLKESIEDAEFALRLEPQNQEIKKQHAEVKSLYEKEIFKKVSEASKGVSKSNIVVKKIQKNQPVTSISQKGQISEIIENQVHEIDEKAKISKIDTSKILNKNSELELKPSIQELAVRAANIAKAEAAKNIFPPKSAYQFEVTWRGLSHDPTLQARLLKVTSPTALPQIFKNALSASILIEIIKCIAMFFFDDMDLAVKYLENLTKVPRFDMIIMCLPSKDKSDIVKIWDEVFSKASEEYAEILGKYSQKYILKH